ncbi:MAG: GHKL domain-containing protein [gamma proteobacterium symbiont of Bathyaustriella thionipta]|nr:GHKL domain-containing protein [gamma proteobacterium symbiont of Bathyaustriella thionipta]MCU7949018.1 GHKL domain-containing protein [gamma proteobacterium symbiont of Bathyaustriella thionipta]MCU7954505.1 GHKL domain-containing protein [gamma proteobacterium symbiont of Bathyaustriella thionipta]MCU7955602.1 GHKL domain-containing protein [gamma proteobacterium symbiont of Bathyaustriella thionipta]MCU7965730.1 GHKL domain-containing protein [gamma proteobacterium symbiont of Bathyaustr
MSNLALESEPVIVNPQTLFDHLPVAILIVDRKSVIHYFNPTAETIFGHDILSNTPVTQLSEQFKQNDFNNAIESLSTISQFKTHLNFKHKEGLYQVIIIKNPHIHITDSTDRNDKDDYLLTLYPVKVDSSLLEESSTHKEPSANKESSTNKKLYASHKPNHTSILKKNFKELKQFSRLSAMREISSSLADKLNQPLTAILSYTQAMQRLYQDNASSEDIHNAMKRVVINAENAATIIRKLRSQLKVNVLNYQITCINDLIQESIHLTDLDNPTSPIKLVTHYETEFTSLYIDKIQFRQVIFSLLNNAIDAVLDHAILSPEIVIKTQKDLSHYKITMSDNGPGLPETIKNKLFEPFTTTKKNGIGIGLSMCRHIIDLHKGDISIQSNVQGRTIVTILLPLNPNNT